jgi:hypothetical protein
MLVGPLAVYGVVPYVWRMAVRDKRDKKLTIMVSDEERSMLERIAEVEGVSSSDCVRQYVRRTFAEKFGVAKARKGK